MDFATDMLFFACVLVGGMGAGFTIGDTKGRWNVIGGFLVLTILLLVVLVVLIVIEQGGII